MKYIAGLWKNMLAKRTLSMMLCLALAVTSGGVCIASTNNLVQETRAAGEKESPQESEAKTAETQENTETLPEPAKTEGEILEDDTKDGEAGEEEDTRCLHEFTATWVGYECKLTDYVDNYEPGDEVRISASFNRAVTSQIGLYIDGVWNSFRGEGKKRNITLVPDSDYLNIQISDLKGQSSANLTEIQVEIVRKGEADTGSYLHKFTGLWQGFETKFSDFNPEYEPGDKVRVTVNYSKYVASQLGMNLDGSWGTLTGEGKEISREVTPDNDYLNIQITDMWANYKVGIVSVSVDILEKGPGVSYGGGGGGRLKPTQYTEPGDYVLFSGEANEKYETDDGWLLDCADTDWITLTYSCVPDHENWGILGWGATVDGEWTDGPGYSADSSDSSKEVTQTFSVKYLRRMMKITPESQVSYLNLGAYSDGKIEELALHVGSEIPREDSLFKNGAPNQPWICTDIERILDAPADKYLCVQYASSPGFDGWTVLTWGASVNGEWRNGKSYKVSTKEPTRNHFFSMRMDAFRNMLHLSWDAKVDSIQLSAFNEGRILDIWFSDEKVEDPGNFKKDKLVKEGGYSSPNGGTYNKVTQKDGEEFPQNLTLQPWEWGNPEKWEEIARKLKPNMYIVVEYDTEDDIEPNLQFTMSDGRQQGVTPSYVRNGQAIFSYEDIQDFLPDYLVPQEIANLQISSGDGVMTVRMVKLIKDDTELEDEPIAVLTSSWSGFSTQISKYHSDYQVGDKVKAIVTFDKRLPGAIAFHIGGLWDCGDYQSSGTISRTAVPSDDFLGVQVGEIPKTKSFLKIMDIRVEIPGKKNFNDLVETKGSRSAGMLSSTKKETATAVLSTDEINKGVQVLINIENGFLSEQEKSQVRSFFGQQADTIRIAKVSDITMNKQQGEKLTPVSQTADPISFKVPVPDELQGKDYDFAIVREHEGKLAYLEDLDGNEATVTFASNRFSKFVMVYGEKGAFDQLGGAIKIFRQSWNGWETSYSSYTNKFTPGKETKVTLTFDQPARAFVDYHKPDWTRVEGETIGKSFTATFTPADDSLTIGIADLAGNSQVKLLNVKVEQAVSKITEFTAANQKFTTSFSAYKENFVEGYPVTVKLVFDRQAAGSIGYHKAETLEEAVETASGPGTVLTKTFISGDDWLEIWIANMNGNAAVNLLDIEVQQNLTPIHTFTHSWGAGDDTFSGKLSDYCSDYEVGDTIKITATFDKSSQVKMMTGSGGQGNEITETGAKIILTSVPGSDGFSIQAGDDSRLPLGLLAVAVEIVEKRKPVEGLHQFMEAWAGFESALSDYNADFEPGKETTVTLTFDKEAKAQAAFKTEASNWDTKEQTGREVSFTVTPKEDYINIQITDMAGETSINLLSVKVEQKQEVQESLHEFTAAWDGFEPALSDYLADFEPGKETTVTLTFDKEAKVQAAFKTEASNWDTMQDTGREVSFTVTPKEDYINIQITDMAGETSINLLKVKVVQAGTAEAKIFSLDDFILEEDPVHVFTEAETIILDLAEYRGDDEYEPGQNVAVELNLFSDGYFRVSIEEADMSETAAKAAPATSSNATPVKAAAEKATSSNAVSADQEQKDGKGIYESDEEGMAAIKWQGNPPSGMIVLTVMEMEGTQINLDSVEVKEGTPSQKDKVLSVLKKITEALLPESGSDQEKEFGPDQEQEPGADPEKEPKEKEPEEEKPEEDKPEEKEILQALIKKEDESEE